VHVDQTETILLLRANQDDLNFCLRLLVEPSHPEYRLGKMLKLFLEFSHLTGVEPYHLGVSWQNLTVSATVKANNEVPNLANTLTGMCSSTSSRVILENLTGYVAPGETLLVLGRPGSGCTTLLNVLAGTPDPNLHIRGKLHFNEHDDPTLLKKSIRYVSEDDVHIGALTVEETLRIASELSTPLNFPDREKMINIFVRNIMQLLGLYHVRNSIVGDQLTRGVSGGERKRVTIAEALTGRPSLLILDDYTKGLDALVALEMMKMIRVVSRVLGVSFIVAQYQPSQEIFEHFDKICVLVEGKCVYFGPSEQALPFYENLGVLCPPRRTVPDFLVSLGTPLVSVTPSNSQLNLAAVVIDETPTEPLVNAESPTELCNAYASSGIAKKVNDEIEAGTYIVKQEISPQQQFFLTLSSFVPLKKQFSVLMARERKLLSNDPQSVVARIMRFVIIAVFAGALFLQLNSDYPSGAFSRAGLTYFMTIFIALSVMSAIPAILIKRDILFKHRGYHLYHGAAYYLSNVAIDFPFQVIESFVFVTILYWMADINPDEHGMRYFYTWLCALVAEICMGNLIRMITCGFKELQSVQAAAPGVAILLVFFCGFIISRDNIPGWYGTRIHFHIVVCTVLSL
jgi:ATP-binding cassette, subfamily G (WHITE), member 2, SNQ2